jgi:hypothetical protein
MNITKKVTSTIVGATIVGVLTFGAVASAAGPDGGGDTGATKQSRKEFVCSHQTEVADHLSKAKANIGERIATLTERRAKAEAAGKTEAVARIDKRLTHLKARLEKVTKRADGLPAFIAANCGTTAGPAAGS